MLVSYRTIVVSILFLIIANPSWATAVCENEVQEMQAAYNQQVACAKQDKKLKDQTYFDYIAGPRPACGENGINKVAAACLKLKDKLKVLDKCMGDDAPFVYSISDDENGFCRLIKTMEN